MSSLPIAPFHQHEARRRDVADEEMGGVSARSQPKRISKAPGFTLMELLAAIGIVCVLTALLIPAGQKVISMARKSQCGANFRLIGVAMQNHLTDNDGAFPSFGGMGTTDDGAQRWMHQLYPYVRPGGEPKRQSGEPYAMPQFICPVSQIVYGMNQRLASNSTYNTGRKFFALSVQSPARTVLIAERGLNAVGHPSIVLSNPFPKDRNYGAAAAHGNGDKGEKGFTGGAGGFALFADMHAEFLTKWFGDQDSGLTGDPNLQVK